MNVTQSRMDTMEDTVYRNSGRSRSSDTSGSSHEQSSHIVMTPSYLGQQHIAHEGSHVSYAGLVGIEGMRYAPSNYSGMNLSLQI